MSFESTMLVNSIITDALETIRVATPHKALSAADESRGSNSLNSLLLSMNKSTSEIPYYYDYTVTLTANKQKYFIGEGNLADFNQPYWVDVPFINIDFVSTLYPVRIISDQEALSSAISVTTSFLPAFCRVYREQDTAGITYTVINFLYPPDQDYTLQVRAKPVIAQKSDPSLTIVDLPDYYREFLRLELARRLAPYYGKNMMFAGGTDLRTQWQEEKDGILASVESDMEVKPTNILVQRYRYMSQNIGVSGA